MGAALRKVATTFSRTWWVRESFESAMKPFRAKEYANTIDTSSRTQKIVRNEPDAEAILPEPRSVKKQIPISRQNLSMNSPSSFCRACLVVFDTMCSRNVFSFLFLLTVATFGSGCISREGYNSLGKTSMSVQMPAPGRSKVVFIRPKQHLGGVSFRVYDGERLIGILPRESFFQFDCDPGPHRFVSTIQNDLKVIEANLAPGKIYYAKIAARWGAWTWGVNIYSVYPGCPGELWPQMPEILTELTETVLNAEGMTQEQKFAENFRKQLQEYRPPPEAEVIRPEHGQSQPIRGR